MRIRKINREQCVACLHSAIPGWAVSVLFVLLLFTQNRNIMPLSSLWQPLLLASGLALTVWLLALCWCRNLAAASMMAAAIMLFNGAHFYLLGYVPASPIWCTAKAWEEPRRLVLAFTGMWLVATCGVLARRQPNLLIRPARFVEMVLIANLLFAAGRLALLEAQRQRLDDPQPSQNVLPTAWKDDGRELPTIVNLVLDGYARADVLRDLYGYDNRPFLAELERMGFRVLPEARCNYIQTALSMASSFNMQYLDDLAITHHNRNDRGPLMRMVASNRTTDMLRARGYEIVKYPTGYIFSDQFPADLVWQAYSLNELTDYWLGGSWLGSVMIGIGRESSPQARHVRRTEMVLRTLPKACVSTRPRYIFAHVTGPHPPFFFDINGLRKDTPTDYTINDGSHLIEPAGMTAEAYRRAYVEQLRYLSRRTQKMLAIMLAQSKRPLVILLQSDHGPGSALNWESLEKSDVRERTAILCAVYFYDRRYEALRDDMTSVNMHRVILSQYAGYDLPLLPDRTFFSTWSRPYNHVDVSDKVTRMGSGVECQP